MAINLALAHFVVFLVTLGFWKTCSTEYQQDTVPKGISSDSPYPSLICFLANLINGKATVDDITDILGTPSCNYTMGRREYFRYSKYGFDIVSNEKGTILGIRSIALIPPASASKETKQDMKNLQGLWEWQANKEFIKLTTKDAGLEEEIKSLIQFLEEEEIKSFIQFDGDHFTFLGGGIAPCFCYRIDTSKSLKSIELYCPDSEDQAEFAKQDLLPRNGIYQLKGDALTIRFGNAKELESFEGGKGMPAIKLKRVDFGRMLAGFCLFVP